MTGPGWVTWTRNHVVLISHFPFSIFHIIFSRMTHVSRYVPAKTNEGWPVVGLVVLLATACIVAVTVIHKRTYKHPTDPTWQSGRSAPKGEGH